MEYLTMKPKQCKCDPYYTCKSCRKTNVYTYEEIAKVLGITHQAVWEIEQRAKKKVRYALELLGYNQLEELL